MYALALAAITLLVASSAPGQVSSPPVAPAPLATARVLGVLPNYRTADGSLPFEPLSARRKLYIGYKDATDYPIFFVTGLFAGISQLQGSNPEYRSGLLGFGKRFGSSYGDQAISTVFVESVYPVLLHQDPRYFRRGTGTIRSRAWYAVSRTFVTKNDSGKVTFNASEFLGNSTMVAISTAYSPATRSVSGGLTKLGMNLGSDTFGAVLKEFWPDVKRRYFTRREKTKP